MSFVRLLSPSRAQSRSYSPSPTASSSSAQARNYKPTLSLHVPVYGACYAVASEPDPEDPTAAPRYDLDLSGELEIRMPHGSGRMRCKSIRVGVRSVLKLQLKGKKKEEHELFQTKVEIVGSTSDGVWLDEGSQRFEFTIILPSGLAPQNWVPGGSISHDLYAELEGTPEERSTSPFFRQLSLSSFSSSGRRTPASPHSSSSRQHSPSRSPSPMPDPSSLNAAILSATSNMSITRQDPFSIPQAPTYDESQATYNAKSLESAQGDGDRWISGFHDTHRTVAFIYNPNPTGQVNQLDEQVSSFAPGVGVYEWRMVAEEWHIAAWPLFRFILPDPAPNVTVFSFRYLLAQTVTITSPHDPDNPQISTRSFPFVERGVRPPREAGHPDTSWQALWRGKEAGGKDEGGYKIEAKGQMPKDDVLRPSTLPGVVSPIHVAHKLIAEVYFSVWGETDQGEKMDRPGPGGLRVMRISRPVVVPSCALIPQILNLPVYQPTFCQITGKAADACRLCGSWPHEVLCTKCPPTVIPHLRHDLDPTLIGNKSGQCPLCAGKSFVPDGGPSWNICACGLAIDKTEDRMKAFLLEMDGDTEGRRRAEGDKQEAERGRQMSRS